MNKYIKLVIAFLMIAFSVYMFTQREYGWGIFIIFLTTIPVLLYFRNEYILLAFWQMRNQNIEKAKAWLSKIKNPESQLVRKQIDRKSTRLNSSHVAISYAVFCLKKKKIKNKK